MTRFASLEAHPFRWRLVLVLVFAACFLSPLLGTGYLSDDATDSLLPGVLRVEGYSLAEYIAAVTMHCVRGGRIFPLQMVELHSWFYLVRTPVVHKALVIAGVVLDLALFALLIRRVSRSTGFAAFATCVVVPLFQFRAFFDPILSFFGLLQFIAAGVLASLLALQVHLDTGRRRWLVISGLSYLAVLWMYEFTYPFFLLHVVLIVHARRSWNARACLALPFAAASSLGFLLTILARRVYLSQNSFALEQSQINADPLTFLTTLAQQTSSAFPLSYYLVNHAGLFPPFRDAAGVFGFMATVGGVLVFAGALAACLASLALSPGCKQPGPPCSSQGCKQAGPPCSGRMMRAAWLGLPLGVLPAVLISISARHQKMITWGIGYTPVYLQYFGVGLLIASGVWALLSRTPPRGWLRGAVQGATALLVAAVAGLTYRANSVLVDHLEKPPESIGYNAVVGNVLGGWNHHRANLEAALRSGLVEDVPGLSVVHLANEYPGWHDHAHSRYFYAMHGAKVLHTVPLTAKWGWDGWFLTKDSRQPARHEAIAAKSSTPYRLRDVCLDEKSGYVILSHETAHESDAEIRLFARHPKLLEGGASPAFLLRGERAATEAHPDGRKFERPARELTMIRSGRDWALFSMSSEVGGTRIDPASLALTFGRVSATWGPEFYEPEVESNRWWRWGWRRGVITLNNATDAPREVRISMLLRNRGEAPVVVSGGPIHAEVTTRNAAVPFEREITLSPGAHPLEFFTEAPPVDASPEDNRELYICVSNFKIRDVTRK